MPAKSDPHAKLAGSKYYYRRSLGAGALLPAVGIGVAAGLAAFYLARLFLERTPLVAERPAARGTRALSRSRGG